MCLTTQQLGSQQDIYLPSTVRNMLIADPFILYGWLNFTGLHQSVVRLKSPWGRHGLKHHWTCIAFVCSFKKRPLLKEPLKKWAEVHLLMRLNVHHYSVLVASSAAGKSMGKVTLSSTRSALFRSNLPHTRTHTALVMCVTHHSVTLRRKRERERGIYALEPQEMEHRAKMDSRDLLYSSLTVVQEDGKK